MKALAIVALLALASCATTAPEPEVRISTVYQDRAVACVDADKVPQAPQPLTARPSSLSQALDLALAKVKEWEIFGGKAGPLLQLCTKAP